MRCIKNFPLLLIICLSLSLVACNKDDVDQAALDDEKINQYLLDNNLQATGTSSGLYYIIEDEGNGDGFPEISSTISVHYTGYLLDGVVFDETETNPYEGVLSELILGWQEGIPLFKNGGKGKFFIPSHLGYGREQVSIIPGNSVLIFDIELVNFQ